jgi:nucleoside-diphosphate-sugar epimerase
MKVFVTGATGYVGQNLIPRLKQSGYDITCLLRTPEKLRDHDLFNSCHIINGDITDRNSIRGVLDKSELVIHLAVATPLTNTSNNEFVYQNINVLGTKNLLEECLIAKPKRILCFSSTAAIGRPEIDTIDENTPLCPVNAYGRSKRDADDLISLYLIKYQLPIITLCFPHIYGPGEVHDLFKIIKLIKNGILPQVGFGPNFLPMVYVSDAMNSILLAFSHGAIGEKYIIADDDPHDTRMIRKQVLSVLGIKRQWYPFIPKHLGVLGAYFLEFLYRFRGVAPPVKVDNIKSIAAARCLSINKAKNELGFSPQVGFEEGIRRTILWYKENHLI